MTEKRVCCGERREGRPLRGKPVVLTCGREPLHVGKHRDRSGIEWNDSTARRVTR